MRLEYFRKKVRVQTPLLIVLALAIAATLARLVLISFQWPITNSDEGNMGLLALHIAFRGELPIFFYGLPYMGPVEGYIAAPLFRLFGVSLFILRVGLLPLYTLFVICMYYLTRLLYTTRFALMIVVLLCLGSSSIFMYQLKAVGEYPEMEVSAALIWLLVSWLALTSQSATTGVTSQGRGKRIFLYGVLGLVVGLALWIDFLILPFVAAGAVLMLLFCWRELRSWAGPVLLIGVAIGSFPLIIYNFSAPLDRNSLNILHDIHQGGAAQMAAQHIHKIRQLVGTLLIALPTGTGYNPVCADSVMPLFGPPSSISWGCVILQGAWSIGYMALGLLAAGMAVRVIWTRWQGQQRRFALSEWPEQERQDMIRQCSRLLLLVAGGMTIAAYALSPDAALYPGPTARYLICLLAVLPAVLWPLWYGANRGSLPSSRVRLPSMIGGALLLVVGITFLVGTVRTFAEIPSAQAAHRQEQRLVHDLLQLGATRIYSEYWTCNRLSFASQERIICSALSNDLGPGFNRYAPYDAIVRSSPHPAYVFPSGSPQVAAFEKTKERGATHYTRYQFEGYVVFI